MAVTFLSSLSNIFAYGIIQITRVESRYKSWRWISIVEGSLTCAIAVLAYFVLVDFPESKRNNFLTAEEKERIVVGLTNERGDLENVKITWAVVREVIVDWKVWSM